ncbi:MAG: PglZ domain-containing protein [Anaerolineae bacterium]|nr:PglZ domain-containing protein [Anaerolineae bacterium]
MSIKTFIQNDVLRPRLKEKEVLVVYDPDRRYRELCLEMADAQVQVVDASESSIESREAALAALQTLRQPNRPRNGLLLIYVPAPLPLTEEAKQRDPFALYGAVGAVFPDGDGDEYFNLCLKAKADQPTAIRRIFAENENPSFDVIDAVGGSAGWPHLQVGLQVESARNILFALLAPSPAQQAALQDEKAWVTEAKELIASALGLKLLTRGKSWTAVADELWRYLLFSEFVFDLPTALPETLADVPRALPEAQPVIEELCERLRHDQRTQTVYMDRAEAIQAELNLVTACQAIDDLGVRDTFPFEERTFFAQAVRALQADDMDKLRQILGGHARSVWVGRGENQTEWRLLQTAVSLVESCTDAARQLPEHTRSQDALIDFYLSHLRDVDRLQREFEQAAGDIFDSDGAITTIIKQARRAYRTLSSSVQELFIRHLEKSGWPPPGRLANASVFDKLVAPKLQESGRRVALFLIDALRYELGVELHKQLTEEGQVELQVAFAALPSVTPVGMASLLPGASQNLRLTRQQNKVVPMLADQPLNNVNQRLDVLRRQYGQRFADTSLADFAKGKTNPPKEVELLVLRSNEMDQDFETNPEGALSLISRTFQQIRAALRRLQKQGFQEALIVTDHGFYLNPALEAGDVCSKPSGNVVNVHDRLLLGDISQDAASFLLPATHLGIRGDFNQAAGPRAMVAYKAGQVYFHGGASLPETVVPVIGIQLRVAEETVGQHPTITINYKRGGSHINTVVPVFEITAGFGDLFSQGSPVEILLEAQDKKGNVVGEAKPGEAVNPATRIISVQPGQRVKVTLKMDEQYEGKFSVKALDPTTLTTFSKVEMETNYTR